MRQAIVTLLTGFLLIAGAAGAKTFEEGLQYVRIDPQPPVGTGEDVEVLEFFWYGCPHCRDFEPVVSKWASGLPANVKFTQVPVLFGGPADLHAQMYYALEGMGELARLHEKLFHAMHVDKNKLRDRAAVDAFMQQNGVDLAKFNEAMSSFAVAAKVNRARALMRRYGIRGVPALVVDGRYRSGSGFASYAEMTEVADFVVAKVLAQRKAQASR
ncbi:MAG: thiol:disulfide interchange protein DsbA/DsbL [Chromatiaceae bacterium]|nr:thiol:disulfide interchange protein DsbA/DsbL [Gammaproteobacteria bacterium]MCP5305480.1 thiol:disulfide interchange protein DsbA/DsbL [Chromatiaceae bacterium]MCP5315439.1 thiol:disulfide interchange protein DsbA/DsbL [Chromatiaceae bacterium]